MTDIQSVQQIVAVIRANMANRTEASAEARRLSRAAPRRVAPDSDSDSHRLNGLISQRVKALSPDDPQRDRKAFRIFLECVLLTEFGEELINTPAFYQLVDDVHRLMEKDDELAAKIGAATKQLLNPAS